MGVRTQIKVICLLLQAWAVWVLWGHFCGYTVRLSKDRVAPEAGAQGPNNRSSHLQLFLIKVAQPLQGGHLVEAV